ncbi:MAG: hypothetical protein ACC662_09790, partial [Planctomycetota bacterium]
PWLLCLVALGFLLPTAWTAAPGTTAPRAIAGDDGGKDDGGKDDAGKDPLGDDDEPGDFFDSPTSFTPQQAAKAIARGVAWLEKNQLGDGSWGPIVGNHSYGGGNSQGQGYTHPAGSTALAVYTLLKCKVKLKNPVVRKGFDFLRKRHEIPGGSYETSMMLLAVCATANPYKTSRASRKREQRLKLKGSYRRWAQDLHRSLLQKKAAQGWRYQVTGNSGSTPGGDQDLSSTQLAALALFAANRLRIRTPDAVWEDILAFSLAQQDKDGPEVVTKDPLTHEEIRHRARGFAYIKGMENPDEGKATGGMTACGIANIMMARFVLTDGGRKREKWDKRPDAGLVQASIEDGLTWIAKNWSPYHNPRKKQMNVYHLYWLYAVERAMDLVGKQKIGSRLWYSEMGQQLLNNQREDGSWNSSSTHEPRAVLDTCFALLFLKRATSGQIPFPSITGGTDEPPVDNR